MSIPNPQKLKFKVPKWMLFIGLFGIVNFFIGCWFLIPPNEGSTVYFWFVEFYESILFPSLIFFPVSIIIVVFWFSRLTEKTWSQVTILLVGIAFSALYFMPALGAFTFVSTLRVIDKVKQNNHVYYLVKHYEDKAPYYSVCVSDNIGFSGQCTIIGWKGEDNDPKIYIDEITNMVTVESKNPSFVWVNSLPPKCANGIDENDNFNLVGGCILDPP